MESPTKTEPPFVPLRHTGWATRRTPQWIFGAIIVLVAGVVLVSLSHKPSQAQRASDLTGYFKDVNAGIESCAGGVRDASTAFNSVQAGDKGHLSAAIGIISYSEQNCVPINNQPLSDFTSYQVTESLARFPLDTADAEVTGWASPDATNAQQDMLAVLRATTPGARASANAALRAALRTMDAQRAKIYGIWRSAEHSTGDNAPLPYLPT